MRFTLTTTSLTTAIAAAALAAGAPGITPAQVVDVTGTVEGQLDTTSRIQSNGLLNSDVLVDQRSGLALNTQLMGRLGSSLPDYNRTHASARLRQELDANTRAWSRVSADHWDRTSVHGSMHTRMGTRTTLPRRDRHARVRVYTSDGYHVGHVDRYEDDRVMVRVDGDAMAETGTAASAATDAAAEGRLHAVSSSQAALDQDANAVVLSQTRADFTSAVTGS
ncbi:hypothetical protein [Maricaulis sp.]|uniref:hypothetical protein n=1 Tax=Maricaulis sp. TaxID=1486257 RepID=UPI0026356BE4|nr:hypothetical protein [Maricaulis sp.]